jgi:hypothetical protein
MRDEGIGDFPDPTFTGFLPYPLTAFADLGDPVFDAAVAVCQEGIAFEGLGND